MDQTEQTGNNHVTAQMHVTACLAGQKVEVEVGEECRSLQALKEAVVEALPQLCVEGFDVSVGGHVLDDDEGIVSLEDSVCLDVPANTRGLSTLALREAGREVGEEGLLAAVREGDVGLCTLYLDAGVPIDCVTAKGSTPLLISCFKGHLLIARLLLDRGSTAIDEKDGDGDTPFLHACWGGHVEIARLLLDRGSPAIDEKGGVGATPLYLSCFNGHVEIARLLLDRGAAIDEKGGDGDTPLHGACREGKLEIATLLLDRGAAIDEKNGGGETPLQISMPHPPWGGHLETARLLLDRGCNAIDEKYGADDKAPLHDACVRGLVPVVTLLLDGGCDFEVKTYVEKYKSRSPYPKKVLQLLSERGYDVLDARSKAPRAKAQSAASASSTARRPRWRL